MYFTETRCVQIRENAIVMEIWILQLLAEQVTHVSNIIRFLKELYYGNFSILENKIALKLKTLSK